MSYVEMTKIVGDVRELTDNEVAIVAGGSLSGFIKDCLKAGLATVGGAAFGPAGAVGGFLVGAGNGQSVDDGAKVQGQLSSESGWMPTTANFQWKSRFFAVPASGWHRYSISSALFSHCVVAVTRLSDSSRGCDRRKPHGRSA